MRASTVVAILSLAAGIAPSVALPLPTIEYASLFWLHPRCPIFTLLCRSRGNSWSGTHPKEPLKVHFSDQGPPPPPKDDRPPSVYHSADSHNSWGHGSDTAVNSPTTPGPGGRFPSFIGSTPKPLPEIPGSESQHGSSDPGHAPPTTSEPAKPKPLDAVPKAAVQEIHKSILSTGLATGIIALSNLAGPPPSRRELLKGFDKQIKLAARRAYVRKLLTTPMDDLD